MRIIFLLFYLAFTNKSICQNQIYVSFYEDISKFEIDSTEAKQKIFLGISTGIHYGDERFSLSPVASLDFQVQISKFSFGLEYFYLPIKVANDNYPLFRHKLKEYKKGDAIQLSLINAKIGYNIIHSFQLNIYYSIIIEQGVGLGISFMPQINKNLNLNLNLRSFTYGWPINNSRADVFGTTSFQIGVLYQL